jgi:hypothetical protein
VHARNKTIDRQFSNFRQPKLLSNTTNLVFVTTLVRVG